MEINQCAGWLVLAPRVVMASVTPSSRRRVDGVEADATIQHDGAVKFDFYTGKSTREIILSVDR